MDEEIQVLNKIIALVDEKASKYKNEMGDMSSTRATVERKLILDLIDNGLDLAGRMKPQPFDTIQDLKRLKEQFQRMI